MTDHHADAAVVERLSLAFAEERRLQDPRREHWKETGARRQTLNNPTCFCEVFSGMWARGSWTTYLVFAGGVEGVDDGSSGYPPGEETCGVGVEDYSKQLPCDPQFTGLTTTFVLRILQAFGIALQRGGKRNSELGWGKKKCVSVNLVAIWVTQQCAEQSWPHKLVRFSHHWSVWKWSSGHGHAKHMQTHSDTD